MNEFDLIIIGQGSAAFAAAIKANDLGVKTAMVGGNATPGTVLGGTCVNVGCVPSKRLITIANKIATCNSDKNSSSAEGKRDFRQAVLQKDALVKRFRKEKYARVLEKLQHVEYVKGMTRFVSKNQVTVNGKNLTAKNFLIATGAQTFVPQVKGLDGAGYLTNEEALSLVKPPSSLCVVGGGALGLEFAQLFAQFGSRVTVLQKNDRILPRYEPEISFALQRYLEEVGIRIFTGAVINAVEKTGSKKRVTFAADGRPGRVQCEQLLLATGRIPNTRQLGLKERGVAIDARGFIKVNGEMQTNVSNIWAAGDVIGEPMLETIAAKEGATAVENAFTAKKKQVRFHEVPSAVFTYPEAAKVGLTDAEANQKGIPCTCRVLSMDSVPKAHIMGDTRGLVKLVAHRHTRQILGVSILAPRAADMIHEATLAVKFKLTVDDLIDTVHVFPTMSEALKLAAQSFYKNVDELSCCTE